MSKHATIDSLEFAEKSHQIHDRIALLDLERLSDVLFSPAGELNYSLEGGVNALGKPQLHLQVSGRLQLVCQRCLNAMPFDLHSESHLVIVPSEDAIPVDADDQDDIDYIVADQNQSVAALVEDEVLLSLPLAPVHEGDDCAAPINREQEQKESPFKVLQGLKGSGIKS